MTYKGQESHQTNCGGVVTIFFFTGLTIFFCQRLLLLVTFGNDVISQNNIFQKEEDNYLNLTRDLLDF